MYFISIFTYTWFGPAYMSVLSFNSYSYVSVLCSKCPKFTTKRLLLLLCLFIVVIVGIGIAVKQFSGKQQYHKIKACVSDIRGGSSWRVPRSSHAHPTHIPCSSHARSMLVPRNVIPRMQVRPHYWKGLELLNEKWNRL